MSSTESQKGSHVVNLLAGGCAGATVDAVLFPLDTLKTIMQARNAKSIANFSGFYRGLGSAMAASFPAAGIFFMTYEYSKDKLRSYIPEKHNWVGHMIAAGAADVVTQSFRVPFEVVKQQLQAGRYSSTQVAVKQILKDSGVRGLYAGYTSTLAREIPFDAIEFALYEFLKTKYLVYKREKGGGEIEAWEGAVLGSFAGGVAAATTCPLDVVKTRLMTQTAQDENPYNGKIIDTMVRIYKEEGGWRPLFKGIQPRVAWISLGGAIFFGAYEGSKAVISPMWNAE